MNLGEPLQPGVTIPATRPIAEPVAPVAPAKPVPAAPQREKEDAPA